MSLSEISMTEKKKTWILWTGLNAAKKLSF
jgi:hypothetical protein